MTSPPRGKGVTKRWDPNLPGKWVWSDAKTNVPAAERGAAASLELQGEFRAVLKEQKLGVRDDLKELSETMGF